MEAGWLFTCFSAISFYPNSLPTSNNNNNNNNELEIEIKIKNKREIR